MNCLECLYCKNPKWQLKCSRAHWFYEDLKTEKKVALMPKEQKKRNFVNRKLFNQAEKCYDYNEMD